MLDKAKKSLIGMFVSGAIVLLVGALFILSPNLFSKDKFTFVCYFSDSLKGLSIGSPVYLLGVPVGRVEAIRIGDPLNRTSYVAPVWISLDRQNIFAETDKAFFDQEDANALVSSYIAKGLVAQIQSQSLLTGQLSIELSFKTPNENSKIAYNNEDVLIIPTTLERLSAVWEKVSEVPFAEIANDLEGILTNIDTLLSSVQNILEQSNVPQLANQVQVLLETLMQTAQNFNTMIVSNEGKVENLLSSFNTLSQNSNALVKNLSVTTSSDSYVLIQLTETLKALEEASKAIAEIATLLEIKPDALIFGK